MASIEFGRLVNGGRKKKTYYSQSKSRPSKPYFLTNVTAELINF
jgi:hypothetical protein